MHTFRVWAPDAHAIGVSIGTATHSLHPSAHGWWSGEVKNAGPGIEYLFSVDGGQPLPDPRSPFQPLGVHGPSLLIDHAAFQWSDDRWQAPPLSSAIVYELHVGTFTPQGTFRSAISRLDYLVELGISHVELMPVNEFSGDWGWGYDGVDLYAPHHAYGTPDDLKALVDACHARGLAVLLDVVYNHLGPAGNCLSRFGPYFTDAYHTPWGAAVNLDHAQSPEVRRFFVDNALMWLRDYHCDGLRLDAVHAFHDRSAIHFLEQLAEEVDKLGAHLGRHFVLIAESDLNDPRLVTCVEGGGFGLDAQWSDDFHHALHAALTSETKGYYEDFGSLSQLGKALQQAYVYDGIHSTHRERVHGRPPIGLSGHHFLGYSQNHDQIGNRANGERLSHLVSVGRTKIAAAIVLTSAFVPMLFQGEEFAASSPFQYFTHHEDPELARSVSEGRRNEFAAFGWNPEEVPDPQSAETLERSKLRWDELLCQPHAEILDWYKKMIRIRRRHSSLTDGRMDKIEVRCDEGERWLAIRRGHVEVACNLSADRRTVPIVRQPANILCSEAGYQLREKAIELAPDSIAILS